MVSGRGTMANTIGRNNDMKRPSQRSLISSPPAPPERITTEYSVRLTVYS